MDCMMRAVLAVFASLFIAMTPAYAEWHKAETDRFVIYSDSSPEDLRIFAEQLERFHVAMELETGPTFARTQPAKPA